MNHLELSAWGFKGSPAKANGIFDKGSRIRVKCYKRVKGAEKLFRKQPPESPDPLF
jgi:hypothetical protein